MQAYYTAALAWLEQHPDLYTLLSALLLLAAALLANFLVRRILVRGIYRALRASVLGEDQVLMDSRIISRLANIVPAFIVYAGVGLVPDLPDAVVQVVRNVCSAIIVLVLALAIGGSLNLVNELYARREDAHRRPVKGYVQVVQIVVYLLALGHPASVVRATSMIFFMLSGMTSMVPMSFTGLIGREVLTWTAIATPVLLLGSWLGTWGFHRASPQHHRITALTVLSVLSVVLIGRALWGTG